MGWILVVSGAAVGAGAGAAMRLVLGRLPRGALVRAPVCEVAVAVLWATVALGSVVDLVPAGWVAPLLGLTWLGVAVTVVDLRHRRIPDALTFPALPLALVCAIPLGGAAVCRGLAGAAVAVAVHAVVHTVSPRSMGAGDVKLAAPLGAVLATAGWFALPLAAVLAALLTATIGTVVLLSRAVAGPGASGLDVVGAGVPGVGVPAAAPVSCPSASSPAASDPATAGPPVASPAAGGPVVVGPAVVGPAVGGPVVVGPAVGGLAVVGPAVGGPVVVGPAAGGPAVVGSVGVGSAARVRGSAFPHGPSMALAAIVVTGWFAMAGVAPVPDAWAPGPVPAGRAGAPVGVPGWA